MDELRDVDSKTESKVIKKNRMVTLRVNRDLLAIIVCIVIAVLAYFIGYHNGQTHAKKDRSSTLSETARKNGESVSNRWTSVGAVQEVSDSKIKVKDSRNEIKDAKITKDTAIVDRKGAKLTAKDIKKDQRVIVSGIKDDKNNLTATRVRIQQ